MTYIEEYYKDIQSGNILASKEIKAVVEHLYKKLSDNSDGYHYDEGKGNRIIEFCEKFCHLPKTKKNPLVKLMLWQKVILSSIFGFVDGEGNRQYQECLIIMGRKNAKSTLSAMIALYLLLCDNEKQPEVYSTASKKEQAKILWTASADMIKMSPQLQKFCKVHIADIKSSNGGVFKPLASQSNTLDGLNSSCVICDEIHAYKDDSLYNVCVDSTSARSNPLTVLISTAGFIRQGFYDSKLQEYENIINGWNEEDGYKDVRRLPFIFKLDSEEEFFDKECWVKANPGLGEIRSLQALKDDVERAKTDELKKKNILAKFFNIPQTGIAHYFSLEDVTNKELFDMGSFGEDDISYAIGGFDLSQTTDLTSACVMFKKRNCDNLYVLSMSWIPKDLLEEKIKHDKVPYDIWVRKGYLRVCNGNTINYHDVTEWFKEIGEKYGLYFYKIGFDRWSANYLVEEIKNTFGNNVLVPVAQGAKTLSLPIQNMKAEFQNKNILYNENPVLKWCLLNLMVVQDTNGNLNTTKNRASSSTIRDDAASALLNALVVYYSSLDDYNNLINDD